MQRAGKAQSRRAARRKATRRRRGRRARAARQGAGGRACAARRSKSGRMCVARHSGGERARAARHGEGEGEGPVGRKARVDGARGEAKARRKDVSEERSLGNASGERTCTTTVHAMTSADAIDGAFDERRNGAGRERALARTGAAGENGFEEIAENWGRSNPAPRKDATWRDRAKRGAGSERRRTREAGRRSRRGQGASSAPGERREGQVQRWKGEEWGATPRCERIRRQKGEGDAEPGNAKERRDRGGARSERSY